MELPFGELNRVLDSEIHCGYDDGTVDGGLTTYILQWYTQAVSVLEMANEADYRSYVSRVSRIFQTLRGYSEMLPEDRPATIGYANSLLKPLLGWEQEYGRRILLEDKREASEPSVWTENFIDDSRADEVTEDSLGGILRWYFSPYLTTLITAPIFIVLSLLFAFFAVGLFVVGILDFAIGLFSGNPLMALNPYRLSYVPEWLWWATTIPLFLIYYTVKEVPKLWNNQERHLFVRLFSVSGLFLASLLVSAFFLLPILPPESQQDTGRIVVKAPPKQFESDESAQTTQQVTVEAKNIPSDMDDWEQYESDEFGFTVLIPVGWDREIENVDSTSEWSIAFFAPESSLGQGVYAIEISGEALPEKYQLGTRELMGNMEWYIDQFSENVNDIGGDFEVLAPPTLTLIASHSAVWTLYMLNRPSSPTSVIKTALVSVPKWQYKFDIFGRPDDQESIDSYYEIIIDSIEFTSSDTATASASSTNPTPKPKSTRVAMSTPTRIPTLHPTSTPMPRNVLIVPNGCWAWTSVGKNMKGTTQCVCGEVVSSNYASGSKNKPTFLNVGRPYPNHTFTVVIWGRNRDKFPSSPENYYLNKNICVTGDVETYDGLYQIEARRPSQIYIATQ